jgi:hypothetical protein
MGLLFAGVFLALSLTGLLLFRSRVSEWIHTETRANDLVGVALGSFSVLYGILLGLVAVGAYQNFSSVSDLVDREASSLSSLYLDVGQLPDPYRFTLQNDLRKYVRDTIDVGWPMQRKGVIPTGGTKRLNVFFDDLSAFKPTDKRTEFIFAEAFRQLNNLVELRRARLAAVTTGLPAVLWWVVGLGAFMNIVLVWMLDMEIHVHVILAAVLSLFLGLVIFLVAAMDCPFRGQVSVAPDALELVYQTQMLGS